MSPTVPNTPVEVAELNLLVGKKIFSVINYLKKFPFKVSHLRSSFWPNLGPAAAHCTAKATALRGCRTAGRL